MEGDLESFPPNHELINHSFIHSFTYVKIQTTFAPCETGKELLLYPLSPAKRESLRGRKMASVVEERKERPQETRHYPECVGANVAQQTLLPLRRLYGLRLRSKQSLRHFYPRLKEKQFKKLLPAFQLSQAELQGSLDSVAGVAFGRGGVPNGVCKDHLSKHVNSHLTGPFAVNGFVQKAGGRSLRPGDLIEVVSKDSLRQAVADVVMTALVRSLRCWTMHRPICW